MIKIILDLLASLAGIFRGRQDAANAPEVKAGKVATIEQEQKDADARAIARGQAGDLEELRRRAAE